MKNLLLAILVLVTSGLLAQPENKEEKKDWGIKFGGFVKTDFWFDTRKSATARDGLLLIVPLKERLNREGIDLHDKQSFNFSAVTSRLRGGIKGPDAFNAKTSGLIEADFSGVTNDFINHFRLRHAYMKLTWEKSELMLGQYWHPLFTPESYPGVVSLNLGIPYQPFVRNPQVRYDYKINKLKIIAALIAQRDYVSQGYGIDQTGNLMVSKSHNYMSESLMPNAYIETRLETENHLLGIAADFKSINPMPLTDSGYVSNERIESLSLMAYYRFKHSKLQIKMKSILGQNLTEMAMFGGFATTSIDSLTKIRKFEPLNNLTAWANVLYGGKFKIGLFLGYLKNLGCSSEISNYDVDMTAKNYSDNIVGFFPDIAYSYRIAPSLHFKSGKVLFMTELEYTVAGYGVPDIKGIPQDVKEYSNTRLLFTALYLF